jgi:hypothetical protein
MQTLIIRIGNVVVIVVTSSVDARKLEWEAGGVIAIAIVSVESPNERRLVLHGPLLLLSPHVASGSLVVRPDGEVARPQVIGDEMLQLVAPEYGTGTWSVGHLCSLGGYAGVSTCLR